MNTTAQLPSCVTIDEARLLAREFAARAKAHFGKRLKRIRLFGSTARGDWTPESDIDILVLLDHVTSADEEWLIHLASHLGVLGCGILIQPLFMTETAFNHRRDRERLFALDVEKEGIEL